MSTAATDAEQPIPPRLYDSTSVLNPKWLMSIAAKLGVGVKQLKVVMTMSTYTIKHPLIPRYRKRKAS